MLRLGRAQAKGQLTAAMKVTTQKSTPKPLNGSGKSGGPGRTGATQQSASGFRPSSRQTEGVEASTIGGVSGAGADVGVNEPEATAALSALIALQDVGGVSKDGRGRGAKIAAARRLLDLLDNVRTGLLTGRLQVHDLERLSQLTDPKKENTSAAQGTEEESDDIALGALLDEVVLRARVELAKLGR